MSDNNMLYNELLRECSGYNKFVGTENCAYKWIEFTGEDAIKARALLSRICFRLSANLGSKIVSPLTESETYVLRKYYGFYDGKHMSKLEIAKELGLKSATMIDYKLNTGKKAIVGYIRNIIINNYEQLSSFDFITDKKEFKNESIGKLCDDTMVKKLRYLNIYTFKDLLCYSSYQFAGMRGVGSKTFGELQNSVHKYGLCFSEEIPENLRKSYIENPNNLPKVLNSNTAWIDVYSRGYSYQTIGTYLQGKIAKGEELTPTEQVLENNLSLKYLKRRLRTRSFY